MRQRGRGLRARRWFKECRFSAAAYADGLSPGGGLLYPVDNQNIVPNVERAACIRDKGGRINLVGSWTYVEPVNMKRTIDAGANYLIVDHPDTCKAVLAESEIAQKYHLAKRGERPVAGYPAPGCRAPKEK